MLRLLNPPALADARLFEDSGWRPHHIQKPRQLVTPYMSEPGGQSHAPIYKGSTKFETRPDVKNIMITGSAGFIGSWLARHLTLTYPEYTIVCFDTLEYCASIANIQMLQKCRNFHFYYGDITIPSDVGGCIAKHNIDTIFHLAAQSHVDLSFGNSFSFTKANVYGTHVMLESAREHGIQRFIHVSTDEVYGEVDENQDDLVESSLLAPTNPYAASKAAAEMLINAYWKSFKLPVIIVRCNNVYGPHQYPEKIIPKFACLLKRGESMLLHGDGMSTRRYLWAGDACDAFDVILHKGSIGQIYNVSSEDEDVAPETKIQYTQDRPFNDRRYAVNGDKIKDLGWSQKVSFEQGLAETVRWYSTYGEIWWGDISSLLTAFPTIRT